MLTVNFITYGLLLFSVASIWALKVRKITYTTSALTVLCAYIGGSINSEALLVIITYFMACLLFFRAPISNWAKAVLWLIIFCLSTFMMQGMFFGFKDWKILVDETTSATAAPYTLSLDMAAAFTGLGLLLFGFKNIRTKKTFFESLAKSAPTMVVCLMVLMISALTVGIVEFEPKVPNFLLTWMLINLFVFSVSQEMVFRYFLLGSLLNIMEGFKFSGIIAMVVSSAIYLTYLMPLTLGYAISAFIASMFFSYVFVKTRKVEMSIILHFMVNLMHILLFTYPMLKI